LQEQSEQDSYHLMRLSYLFSPQSNFRMLH